MFFLVPVKEADSTSFFGLQLIGWWWLQTQQIWCCLPLVVVRKSECMCLTQRDPESDFLILSSRPPTHWNFLRVTTTMKLGNKGEKQTQANAIKPCLDNVRQAFYRSCSSFGHVRRKRVFDKGGLTQRECVPVSISTDFRQYTLSRSVLFSLLFRTRIIIVRAAPWPKRKRFPKTYSLMYDRSREISTYNQPFVPFANGR